MHLKPLQYHCRNDDCAGGSGDSIYRGSRNIQQQSKLTLPCIGKTKSHYGRPRYMMPHKPHNRMTVEKVPLGQILQIKSA
jgi:hypothetical protein